jgi:hypothetical protein
MRAEFGFTLTELREVCGGLLDLATADQVTRIALSVAISEIASKRDTSEDIVSAVLGGITLTQPVVVRHRTRRLAVALQP